MKTTVSAPENSRDENEILGLALTSIENADFGDAIVYLKDLLALNPEHEIATGTLAAIYAGLKMTERATEYFQRVLAINPENPLARVQLGLLQFSTQQPQDALNTWETCRLEGSNEFLLHFYRGLALLQLGKPGEARPLLEITRQHLPEDHPLYPQLQDLLTTIQE